MFVAFGGSAINTVGCGCLEWFVDVLDCETVEEGEETVGLVEVIVD
jgi:hypothetical protein